MDPLRNEILRLLNKYSGNEPALIKKIHSLSEKKGDEVFRTLLNVLTHLNFKIPDAKDRWNRILSHKKQMEDSLKRNVTLMTAICDFFGTINRVFRNPKVVEIQEFEETAESSHRDALTNLFNRRYFDDALAKELSRAKRYEEAFSLIFFDLDNFKNLNDSLGHPAGDVALKNVAQALTMQKRAEDTLARYGGEEMILMLPKTSKYQAKVIAERIRKYIEMMLMEHEDKSFKLTLSGGVASFPADALEEDLLVQCADKAMYMAKEQGKNKIVLYTPQERRTHLRVKFLEEIRVIQVNTSAPDLQCKIKNMSPSGILIETKEAIKTGTKVHLQLPNQTSNSPVNLTGKVARVKAIESAYETGVVFLAVNEKEKNQIADTLARYLDSSN